MSVYNKYLNLFDKLIMNDIIFNILKIKEWQTKLIIINKYESIFIILDFNISIKQNLYIIW